jgi:hypothetical protein
LYGVKSGLGKFNPIMVENINKLPEPEEFEDPKILNKNKSRAKTAGKSVEKSAQKSGRKSDLNKSLNKSASRNNMGSKMSLHDSPTKSSLNLVKM